MSAMLTELSEMKTFASCAISPVCRRVLRVLGGAQERRRQPGFRIPASG